MIENPIIPGFNPDPSILRVNDCYYIATSTFEWFPGIAIYKSMDLKNWELINHAVKRREQIDLRGVDSALGIWAPSLSYDKNTKTFYVCFSVINGAKNNNFDLNNYLMYTDNIASNWSMPVYLNSSGFDPSLFHDDDGKCWLVNLEWDFRKGYEHPGAIVIEEYDCINKRLLGGSVRISRGGTDRGCLEGPQLFKRNSYYYLVTAEGGTGYGHCVVISRSKNIKGPYESFSKNPIITSQPEEFNERGIGESTKLHRFNPSCYLQRAGHGNIVETQNGEVYITHLCSRPLLPEIRSILGRETCIQKCIWTEDDWLILDSQDNLAKRFVKQPALKEIPVKEIPSFDNFECDTLTADYYSLREPIDSSWIAFEKESMLSMRGRDSLFSKYDQSLIAKKIKTFNSQAETLMYFNAENFMEMAGLTCFYNNDNFYYLRLYYSESLKSQCLGIMICNNGEKDELLDYRIPVCNANYGIYLRAIIKGHALQFYYAIKNANINVNNTNAIETADVNANVNTSINTDVNVDVNANVNTDENANISNDKNIEWKKIGPILDASILSDEYAHGFTGAFVGITVQDLYKKAKWADFDYFSYLPIITNF